VTETISIIEAAKLLGVSKNTAYRAAQAGQIPTIRVGHLLKVPRERLMAMLDGPPLGEESRIEARNAKARERETDAAVAKLQRLWNASPTEAQQRFREFIRQLL
jgi:excisionase family DNA binding protein